MDIFVGVAASAANDDFAVFLIPFEDRARSDAQLTPDGGRNGNLSLGSKFGMSHGHDSYYHGNETVDFHHILISTSTPMLRAVPLTWFMTPSRSKLLRSGILILAISSTCFRLILPTRFL